MEIKNGKVSAGVIFMAIFILVLTAISMPALAQATNQSFVVQCDIYTNSAGVQLQLQGWWTNSNAIVPSLSISTPLALERSANLVNWQAIFTNFTSNVFIDTNPPASLSFYRVRAFAPTPPAAPTLSYSASTDSLVMSETQAVAQYKLYVANAYGGPWTYVTTLDAASANPWSANYAGYVAGKYYHATAIASGLESDPSNVIQAPSAPTVAPTVTVPQGDTIAASIAKADQAAQPTKWEFWFSESASDGNGGAPNPATGTPISNPSAWPNGPFYVMVGTADATHWLAQYAQTVVAGNGICRYYSGTHASPWSNIVYMFPLAATKLWDGGVNEDDAADIGWCYTGTNPAHWEPAWSNDGINWSTPPDLLETYFGDFRGLMLSNLATNDPIPRFWKIRATDSAGNPTSPWSNVVDVWDPSIWP